MTVAIVYGSSTGMTADLAQRMVELWRRDVALIDAAALRSGDLPGLARFPLVVVACPTWDIGELQADWRALCGGPLRVDLTGVRAAFVGIGDPRGYPATYQDAMGILFERFRAAGATVGMGATDPGDDVFEASRALMGGRFCGLAIDEDAPPAQTDARVRAWLAQLDVELDAVAATKPPRSG